MTDHTRPASRPLPADLVAHVKRAVDAAPPLTDAQRQHLAALLTAGSAR